ncbi:DMT family transporter [Rhizobium sp. TH2]|uniref:DMT family transporter n=1 Tax=Rhizobium sp. TH2 TaxID=2775403 RepID=UPI002157C1D4|nr:DMT family transporter [Rhizobium sp. TH2]UVC07754.1 DMT family transporter [Rhizobium sp. TH2]
MSKTVLAGVLSTVAAYFLFSLQDASVKWLVVSIPVIQILFVRSVTILAICLAIGRGQVVREAIHSPIVKPMLLRTLLLLAAWLSYYNAARTLGLAELTTLYYAAPILITILAVPILKEEVPPVRWMAVVIGFVGVLVATDMISTGLKLSWPVWLALQAAIFWAISTVLLRKTALSERTIVQMTISNFLLGLFTGMGLVFYWVPVTSGQLLLTSLTGVIAALGQFAMFEGMRRAPVSILAPFEYTSLVWAFILGFAIWGDIPDHNIVFGAALIFAAGVTIVLGERFGPRSA